MPNVLIKMCHKKIIVLFYNINKIKYYDRIKKYFHNKNANFSF